MKRTALFFIIPIGLALLMAACGGTEPESQPAVSAVEESPPEPVAEVAEEPVAEPPADPTAFSIVSDETEARFVVNEILNGAPKVVVGATNAVTGDIVADFADTSSAQVTSLMVDASTLTTDNNFRNRAVREAILQTNDPNNQFVQFVSTSISGLPASVSVGETYPFQITGNLTVKGAPSEVTFEASVTPVSATRLEGSATTNVIYGDLGVAILRLPEQVASVEDALDLQIYFVAEAQ